MPKKIDTKEFIRRSKEKHGDVYDYSKSVYSGAKVPIEIVCSEHGPWKTLPYTHYIGHGCYECGHKKISSKIKDTTVDFIQKAKNIYGDKYDYSEVDYVQSNKKVILICNQHGSFEVKPHRHLLGQQCPLCTKEKVRKDSLHTTEYFIKKSKEFHGNLYDYSLSEYSGKDNKVQIICNEHGPFFMSAFTHRKGAGCPVCGIIKQGLSRRDNTESFIVKAYKVHGNTFNYSLVDYHKSNIPVEIICKKHGSFTLRPCNHLNGQGCPTCAESKGERLISKILDKYNILYFKQHKFDDCVSDKKSYFKLPFDFYLPNYNCCIEFDGRQHFMSIDLFGGDEGLKRRKNLDKIKSLYCKKNKINLIRVPYDIKKDSVPNFILNGLGIE